MEDTAIGDLIPLFVKIPATLDSAIDRYRDSQIGRGLLPSKSDVVRQLLVAALEGLGFAVEPGPPVPVPSQDSTLPGG